MNCRNSKLVQGAPLLIFLLLSACGGGGDSSANGTVPATANSVAASVRSSAPLSSCPNGGISVDAGIDTNSSGVLDLSEVTSTQYVCNGANGANGTGGLNALVSTTAEPAGANCANGGKKVSVGQDANLNNVLDVPEIASSAYICDGLTGSSGTNGSNGANGFNALTAIVAEAAGANCATGGLKLTAGLDTNANGILDSGEITSTSYICNGAGGTNGSNGANGLNGLNSLTVSVAEPAGANCAIGGSKLISGLDANANAILDAGEITSTSYVCTGASGTNGSNGSNGLNSLTVTVAESAGANCASGGLKLTAGLDTNANGILDAGEVTSTSYICNGASGTNGSNGANGLNSLTVSVAEPAGANCATGGSKLTSGLDTNANGVLDSGEVTSTTYVCTGASGLNSLTVTVAEPAGVNCASGGSRVTSGLDANANAVLDAGEVATATYLCNGIDGTNGTNGTNGLNTLVVTVAEPAGANCASGGSRVSYGLDANANSVLEFAEVTSTTYVCNGATGPAGPGVTWVDVTGTSVQAVSNTGYMADNAAQVTVTLPASPAVGDVVQVSGIGAGGWKIAQNAGQSIITRNVVGNIGATWTARETARNWTSVASSADGTRLAAVVSGGQIYTSTDSGATWTARETARNWYSVASSSDGTKLVAVAFNGQILTSTDSGATWTARDSARSWTSVASSSDGTKLVAVEFGGQIYTSTDSGVSWTARDLARNWKSVASSSDGTKLVAAEYMGGRIYTSTNSGVTWTARGAPSYWQSVASSSDGTKLAAVVQGGQIYTSTDSGVTWTARESNRNWNFVASSSDGTRLAAGVYGGQIYTSTDSGATWTAREMARNWQSVASSADGSRLAAVVSGGQIYTSVPTTVQNTTAGTAGSISGAQYDAIELQYAGNNTFMVLSYAGYLTVQ